jgi:glycosyltransferase involved in cell wall biosynthesis
MRIAFDARPLLGPRTGVGVWLELLLRELAHTDWRLALCLPRREPELGLGELATRCEIVAPAHALPGTLWLHTLAGPALAGRADVYVGTLGILPRRLSCPAALVVNDITPLTRPRHHTLANRFCFNAYFAESLQRADEIVCISAATRDRLRDAFPAAGRRARVIGLAADPFFSPPADGRGPHEARERFAGGRPFVVQLGTLEPRKGITTLVAAHALLVERMPDAPDLVLAGGRGWGGDWLAPALARHPRRDRIHLPGYVERAAARDLLRHAEAVALASEEEGFGLPLAEALACGARCVISDEPALVEVAGGAARVFPRGDARALAGALAEVLTRERAPSRGDALARAQDFSIDRMAAAWRALLAELGQQHPKHPFSA